MCVVLGRQFTFFMWRAGLSCLGLVIPLLLFHHSFFNREMGREFSTCICNTKNSTELKPAVPLTKISTKFIWNPAVSQAFKAGTEYHEKIMELITCRNKRKTHTRALIWFLSSLSWIIGLTSRNRTFIIRTASTARTISLCITCALRTPETNTLCTITIIVKYRRIQEGKKLLVVALQLNVNWTI